MALAAGPLPAQAKANQVAVVPIRGKAGPAFDGSVARLIEKPLKRHAGVVPTAQVKAAAKRARIKPAAMHIAKNIKALGRAVGATHVLIVEATGRGKSASANSTLVEVSSGRTLLSDRYALAGGKLTPDVASQLLSPVVEQLGGGGDGGGDDGGDAAADEAGEASGGDEGDDEGASKPMAKAKAGKGGAWGKSKASGDDEEASSDDESAATEEPAEDAEDGDEDGVAKTVKKRRDDGAVHQPALRIAVGGTFLQRTARITPADGAAGTAPCYCGTDKNANPFFPALQLAAEFFPMAMGGGSGEWYDNLGVTGEAFVAPVKSFVDKDPKTTISSTVMSFKLAATYRLLFGDALDSPDIYAKLGYSQFAFPLANTAFPGVAYGSPFVGLTGHLPLSESFAIVAGGSYMVGLTPASDAATVLGAKASASAYSAEGGLRVAFGDSNQFEVSALVRLEAYALKYTGDTTLNLNNNQAQFKDVSLSDTLKAGTLTFGMVF
ncbi:MAG TPA: hypothetical protein VFH51_12050 [Myxococcota bacterium]|nr:hypothetical protein [Myxococcota bacterium]